MITFSLSSSSPQPAVFGPYGSLQRARLYAPDNSTVIDLALVEGLSGTFTGTVNVNPTPDDSTSPYNYEVRQVLTQSGAGFNASTTPTISLGTYAYLNNGLWSAVNTLPNPPTSDLFTYAEFVHRFGLRSITLASNKDNAKAANPDFNAIQQSFNYCVSEVYDALRGGVYAVPLVFTTENGLAPSGIKDPAMTIAFGNLYEVRGWEDKNRVGNKQERNVQMAYNKLGWIKAGIKQIQAQIASGITLAATAVTRENVLQDRVDSPVVIHLRNGCVVVERPESMPGME